VGFINEIEPDIKARCIVFAAIPMLSVLVTDRPSIVKHFVIVIVVHDRDQPENFSKLSYRTHGKSSFPGFKVISKTFKSLFSVLKTDKEVFYLLEMDLSNFKN